MMFDDEVMAVLADRTAPISRLTRAVSAAEAAAGDLDEVTLALSGSVTIEMLGLFLRREALLAGRRARIVQGGYDDPIGDLESFAREGVKRVVMVPFLDNILPAFEARVGELDPEAVAAKEAELRARYRLAFERAQSFDAVDVALYHRMGEAGTADGSDAVAAAADRLNRMLREEAAGHTGIRFFDIAPLIQRLGRAAAFDRRFYFQAKAPYSAALLSSLAQRLAEASRGFGSYFYKALAVDCDNTLWGGIIGEDLLSGIRLDPYDYPGNVFWRVQHMLASLERAGLLLCLCTKNNPDDVAEVFRSHPHMVLKDDQIAVKRVNWNDKVSNLQAIAAELNIGLDALIFLDDSPVEAESVRARLPMVKVVEVPRTLSDYPAVIEQLAGLYLRGGVAAESRSKTEDYRRRAAAAEAQAASGSHEEYLASLDLQVELHTDRRAEVPRISELSMKSNQFNLTTTRYSESAVTALMDSPDAEVISISVANKFGSSGLTGILTLRFAGAVARIENFLMSCRVLGQGVEFAFWPHVAERCLARGCTEMEAAFVPTAKNAQVADFFDRLGFTKTDDEVSGKRYRQPLASFSPPDAPWIKIIHA
jgi:FkbH-like protein